MTTKQEPLKMEAEKMLSDVYDKFTFNVGESIAKKICLISIDNIIKEYEDVVISYCEDHFTFTYDQRVEDLKEMKRFVIDFI